MKVNNGAIAGMNQTVIGNYNTVSGVNATVYGDHNTVSGVNAHVYGCDNVVSGVNASAYGQRNKVSGINSTSREWSLEQLKKKKHYNGDQEEEKKKKKNVKYVEGPTEKDVEGDKVTDNEENACVVCLTNAKCCVVSSCQHKCVCAACARVLCFGEGPKKRGEVICPLCRKKARSILRIYE